MASPTALDTDVGELELSIRGANVLANLSVRSVRDLVALVEADLLADPSANPRVVREVRAALGTVGLDLAAARPRTPQPAPPPEDAWGCLFVRAGREEVEREVAAAYAALGLGRRPADQEQLTTRRRSTGRGCWAPTRSWCSTTPTATSRSPAAAPS